MHSLPAYARRALLPAGWCLPDWAREQISLAAVQYLSLTTEGETPASASIFRGSGETPCCQLADARHLLKTAELLVLLASTVTNPGMMNMKDAVVGSEY